jgi:o-succinylbenzoate synthase
MSFNLSNIIKIDLFSYEIPYNKELLMMGSKSLKRKGLFLKVEDKDNNIIWGEISPFPGLHKENINDIIKYINSNDILNDLELIHLNKACNAPLSLVIAYEQILFYYKFNHSLINDNTIRICPLLSGNSQDIIDECDFLNKQDINCIKLKLGQNKLNDDIKLFNIIDNKLNNKINIRIDANQSWTYEEASIFAKNINISRIDYIEEPLININEINKYYDEFRIDLALDETIYQTQDYSILLRYKGCKSFIIKPSLIGGVANINKLKYLGDKNNINLIFSSAFETGYSLAYYIYLSSIYSDIKIAQGFDTYKHLSFDILDNKLTFNNYKISLINAVKSMNTVSEDILIFIINIL